MEHLHLAPTDTVVAYTQQPVLYGKLIFQRRSGATSYYHTEALGSTRQLTNAAQVVTDTYLYDGWGNVLSASGSTLNPFRYVGQLGYYLDTDTGNSYIRARIYRPTIGRWLSIDPLGFVDGLNLYVAYFVPNGVDPSGMVTLIYTPKTVEGHPWRRRSPLQTKKAMAETSYGMHVTHECRRGVQRFCSGYEEFWLLTGPIRVPRCVCRNVYTLLFTAELTSHIYVDLSKIIPPATVEGTYGHEQRHVMCGWAIGADVSQRILAPAEGEYQTAESCATAAAVAEAEQRRESNRLRQQDYNHMRPFPICPSEFRMYLPIGDTPAPEPLPEE